MVNSPIPFSYIKILGYWTKCASNKIKQFCGERSE